MISRAFDLDETATKFAVMAWIEKAEREAEATCSLFTASLRCHHMYQAATTNVSCKPS